MQIVIVGGGAAGASCAARLRRLMEDAKIIILEKTTEISIANCGLPYYCSDVISDREKIMVSNPSKFNGMFNIEVRLNSELTSINRQLKTVKVNNDYELSYDKLVLATGAMPLIPSINGIDNKKIFTVRTLQDADKIKDFVKNNSVKNAVVVGGGFIGIEMAENFAHLGLNTSLIELSDQLLAPVDKDIVAFAHNIMRDNSINLYLNKGVQEFEDENIILSTGETVPYDIAIMAIGVKPDIEVAKNSGLGTGKRALLVNEHMQTNDENIYAAGDCVEVKDFVDNSQTLIPLAGPANRQGRIIADNISGILSTYKNTQGTSVVKIFDLTVASVGNNEKVLKSKGINYKKSIIQGSSHASYYPESFPIFIKLLFNEEGKILGAQAVGKELVDKRIDVIATVMRLKGKVQDLIDSELAYAPPYSSAKDPVNLLGMAADNILKGLMNPVFYEDLKLIEDLYLIDVRSDVEYQFKTIDKAINIPLDRLRENLDKVPKDKNVVLFCNKGFQSYVALRVLVQKGYTNVSGLAGGFSYYKEQLKNERGIVSKNEVKDIMRNTNTSSDIIKIDACGLQCPGPIMKLSQELKNAQEGKQIEISTYDSGFSSDVESWCKTTGNTLLGITTENKVIKALIQKGKLEVVSAAGKIQNGQTMVVFSGDFDKVMASFIIANGAAASGKSVTMFFTFWGLNVLKKCNYTAKNKSFIGKLFGLMLPKCSDRLPLSKMNMAGMGTWMMKKVMKSKNVFSIYELIETAKENGIKFIACAMSMDVMGINEDELIDGVEIGGVAKYIAETNNANANLFI